MTTAGRKTGARAAVPAPARANPGPVVARAGGRIAEPSARVTGRRRLLIPHQAAAATTAGTEAFTAFTAAASPESTR